MKVTNMYNVVYKGSRVYAEVDVEEELPHGFFSGKRKIVTRAGLVVQGLFHEADYGKNTYCWICLEDGFFLPGSDIRKAYERMQAKELLKDDS